MGLWFAAGGVFPFAECSSQKLVLGLRCNGASALVLQRLAGHANLLLNCLLGAAVHGGRPVRVYEAALDDYAELMDALSSVVSW